MLSPTWALQAAGSTGPAAAPKCPEINSDFGSAVAISGPVAVIGAWDADNFRGAACVFAEAHGAWHQQTVLNDPGNTKWDGFGYSAAVSSSRAGTYAMVGAVGSGTATSSGIVYAYTRSETTWHRVKTLPNPNRAVGASFGSSIAMSGTSAVISDDGYKNGSGIAYVYVKSGTSWRLQATLSNPAPAANANFGGGVSISGSTIIVGDGIQPSPSEGPRPAGARRAVVHARAYVFTRSGSRWHLQGKLTDTSPSPAASAAAVAVSGNVALLGAENGGDGQGETYVFIRIGTTWRRSLILHDPAKDYSNFGTSVALAGANAVIGAPYGRGCGVAYVYERSGQKWRLRVKLLPPKCPANALMLFGWSVAASGETAVVGAGYGGAYVMNFP